jgi:hypothetical protein
MVIANASKDDSSEVLSSTANLKSTTIPLASRNFQLIQIDLVEANERIYSGEKLTQSWGANWR